jgi:hypothetical protein
VSPLDVAIDALVLAWVLYRQRRFRRVRLQFAARVPVVLSLIGLVQFVHFTETHSLGAAVSGIAIGSCVVGGALLGTLRAMTVRLSRLQKGLAQQATWLTMALWAVSVGLHFALTPAVSALHGPIDVIAASLLLYLALSLGAQNSVVHRRAVRFLMRGESAAPTALDARSWEATTD